MSKIIIFKNKNKNKKQTTLNFQLRPDIFIAPRLVVEHQ